MAEDARFGQQDALVRAERQAREAAADAVRLGSEARAAEEAAQELLDLNTKLEAEARELREALSRSESEGSRQR